MSQEEAHRRPAAGGEHGPTGLPAGGQTTDEAVEPHPPLFTARIDETAGVISAHGHLDPIGAEALCRTVTALQQLGHRQVVVRLGSATTADGAHELLADHARVLHDSGIRLLLQ